MESISRTGGTGPLMAVETVTGWPEVFSMVWRTRTS
jgi:hypothetical protein